MPDPNVVWVAAQGWNVDYSAVAAAAGPSTAPRSVERVGTKAGVVGHVVGS